MPLPSAPPVLYLPSVLILLTPSFPRTILQPLKIRAAMSFEKASESQNPAPLLRSEAVHYTPAMKKRERLKIKYNLGGEDITFRRVSGGGEEKRGESERKDACSDFPSSSFFFFFSGLSPAENG